MEGAWEDARCEVRCHGGMRAGSTGDAWRSNFVSGACHNVGVLRCGVSAGEKSPSHKNRPLACSPAHSQIPEVLIQTTYAQESGQGASWALLT